MSTNLYQDPLEPAMRSHMTIVSIGATLSLVTTTGLICYLSVLGANTIRKKASVPSHFYALFLVFNLLLGNCVESFAFALNIVYLIRGSVQLGGLCTAQGMILQVGDMLGSAFTTAIAIQTFFILICRRNSTKRTFYGLILFVWFFSIFLGAPMPAIDAHFKDGVQYYALAGSWCWISPQLTRERLFTHYIYVFFDQFLCMVLYLWIYLKLRSLTRRAANDLGRHHNTERLESSARKMILYPLVYTLTTMPLAIARVSTMLGMRPSPEMICFVGTLFSLSGFCNTLLYGLTRNIFPERNNLDRSKSPFEPSQRTSTICTLGQEKLQMKRVTIEIPKTINFNEGKVDDRRLRRLSTDLTHLEPDSTHSPQTPSTFIAPGSIFVRSETTVVSEATLVPSPNHTTVVFP